MSAVKSFDKPKNQMMRSQREDLLRRKQLVFIGKVISSLTEEIGDCLSTIRASAGRLGDLLAQASQRTQEDQERFAAVLATIGRHLKILAEKNGYLDRFSQRTGEPLSTFDVEALVEEAVSFSTRLAGVRQISLAKEATETSPSLCSDPLRIHFLLLILIESMLEGLARGGKVIVRAGPAEKGVLIEVEGHGDQEPAASSLLAKGKPYRSVVEKVVGDLGGRLQETTIDPDINQTALFLPTEQVANTSQIQSVA